MGLLRRRRSQSDNTQTDSQAASQVDSDHNTTGSDESMVGYNPHRDEYLYWLTDEGYIIAQDVVCQHEYVSGCVCETCGGELVIMAHLNRAGQGLSEMVAICRECRTRTTFIFDISNEVYQAWWAAQLGELYVKQFDGPARAPVSPE